MEAQVSLPLPHTKLALEEEVSTPLQRFLLEYSFEKTENISSEKLWSSHKKSQPF